MMFKQKIETLFKSKNERAVDVGRKIGMSKSMMSRYTNADKPNAEFCIKLKKLWPEDVDLNDLLLDGETENYVREKSASYRTAAAEKINEIETKITELKTILATWWHNRYVKI